MIYEAVAFIRYKLSCPECGESIEWHHDPKGMLIECAECSADIKVVAIR